MTQNTPKTSQETPNTEVFSQTEININGQSISGLDQLPPELQEKIKGALSKMQNYPGLIDMISSMGGLAKSARENGIGVSTIKTTETPIITAPAASFETQLRPTNRNTTMPSATYNPGVKGDGLRRFIFIIAITLAAGYLIIKFGYNGKLPF